jgi:hypothetical protein
LQINPKIEEKLEKLKKHKNHSSSEISEEEGHKGPEKFLKSEKKEFLLGLISEKWKDDALLI